MQKLAVTFALIASALALYLHFSSRVTHPPTLPDIYWGPEESKGFSTDIRPFKIDVSESVIEDLRQRLKKRRPFVEPLEGVEWTYGISSKYLNTILDYWQNDYNWTQRQDFLNTYPQFITNIKGIDLHYYSVSPSNLSKHKGINVRPLLLLHGWPGSVVEFQKIIPMLTIPRSDMEFVFQVIIPSLPGFGFSGAAVRPGMNTVQISAIFRELMDRLGFKKFYIHGEDWGSVIATKMAILYPENAVGLHSTMCHSMSITTLFWALVGNFVPSLVEGAGHSKLYPLTDYWKLLFEESGYFHIQATKPDTIGVAVSAAPEALAAYILEKFSTWTNMAYRNRNDGGLLEKFSLDELLDNIMIYWITNSMTTSIRLYAAEVKTLDQMVEINALPVRVATACTGFLHEALTYPKGLLRYKYPYLIQYNNFPRGGHFAGFEEPELLSTDIYSFVRTAETGASDDIFATD